MEDKGIKSAIPAAIITAIAAVAFAAMMRVTAGPLGALFLVLNIPASLVASFSVVFPLLVLPHFLAKKYNAPIFGSYVGLAVLFVMAIKYKAAADPENLAIKMAVVFVVAALINSVIVEGDFDAPNTES